MHKIEFVEQTTPEWENWKERCATARASVMDKFAKGESFKITDLYKEHKPYLIDIDGPFHGRCAYCEQSIISDQYGDVEHFRPKKGVDHEDWTPVVKNRDDQEIRHPGYYWLAYEWTNLLLSCELCNRPSPGREFGKHNRFPVAGEHAWEPGQEAHEAPILINPCMEDPADHIYFDTKTGQLVPRTDRGDKTIKILGLNHRHLPERRLRVYRDVRMKFEGIFLRREPNWRDELMAIIDDVYCAFPSVVKCAFSDQRDEYVRLIESIPA